MGDLDILLTLSKLRADGGSDVGRQVENVLEIFRTVFKRSLCRCNIGWGRSHQHAN